MAERSSIRWHIWPSLACCRPESPDYPEANHCHWPVPALLFVRMGHQRTMHPTVCD